MPRVDDKGTSFLDALGSIRDAALRAQDIDNTEKQLDIQEQALKARTVQGQQRINLQNKSLKLDVFKALLNSGALNKTSTKTISKELETELLGEVDRTISLKPAQQQTLSLADRIKLINEETKAKKEVILAQKDKDIAVIEVGDTGKGARQEDRLKEKVKDRVATTAIRLLQEGASTEDVIKALQQGTLLGKGKVSSVPADKVVGKGDKKGGIFTKDDPISFSEVVDAFGVDQEGTIIADVPIDAFGGRSITQVISQYSDFVNRTPRPDIDKIQKARDTLLEVDDRIEPFLDRIEGKK